MIQLKTDKVRRTNTCDKKDIHIFSFLFFLLKYFPSETAADLFRPTNNFCSYFTEIFCAGKVYHDFRRSVILLIYRKIAFYLVNAYYSLTVIRENRARISRQFSTVIARNFRVYKETLQKSTVPPFISRFTFFLSFSSFYPLRLTSIYV